ncbi:hypothetical protein [Rugamonas apoptosis]|uniref:Uncharacterized protein n=1 Tax=Rugamonas apoptosis TaxID=2758570 RepID=A0A7W2F8C3_9BURK|nr:hypothetical protein [Rugamonas apoptosis]MBA5686964.1 hypothetical protein [Rugamonas apoptosis]
MMKFLKWLAIVVLLVPVLLVAGFYVRNKAVGPAGWAEDNTIKTLRARMKDPDSMVIRSSYFVRKVAASGDVEIAMCGIVDGKNSFGGFTGGTRFVSVSTDYKNTETFDTHIVQMDESSSSDRAAAQSLHRVTPFEEVYWNGHCVDDAHPALVAEN